MYIIVGTEAAEKLKENYTVLELETHEKDGQNVTAFCVVDQIPIAELPQLDQHKNLHAEFVAQYRKGNYKFCQDAAEHLMGKFNGELDSFYQILMSRLHQ